MTQHRQDQIGQRRELGRSLRKPVPRSSHADWSLQSSRPHAIELLEQQNEQRLNWLVPVRRARMTASPFAFYRAAARIMATDLANTPVSGLTVQACGDAHLANFGLYASPERRMVFDLNDFDETLPGPWEWDLKRLLTSVAIAARHNQLDRDAGHKATRLTSQAYRQSMQQFAEMGVMETWYSLIDESGYLSYADQKLTEKRARKTISRAKKKHSRQALDRLTEEVDGEYRIKSEPPLLVPLRLLSQQSGIVDKQLILNAFEDYKLGLAPGYRALLDRFKPVDFAMKVVGVGSVGTRCWIMLLEGRDRNDPLFLQVKEAMPSVLAEHLTASPYETQGRRVVEGQRLMQTVSDIFLGWNHVEKTGHDFYWRQLRDWKGSVDVEQLDESSLNSYARLCGQTLARAHARSGDPIAISAYLGVGDVFDRAMVEFADRYADQNQQDYQLFIELVRSGVLAATVELSESNA